MNNDLNKKVVQIEHVFSALAHTSRRHILLTLNFRGGRMTAGEIADRFSCSWPTTSRHLNILKNAGLISVIKEGRERYYKLECSYLLELVDEWFNWFRDEKSL